MSTDSSTGASLEQSNGSGPAVDPLLRMSGVNKRFGATIALSGVDLYVDRNEVLALVGENGAGKSTLMKVLSGAHRADSGEMWLDGTVYHPRTPFDARRSGVAMIYQELSLTPHMSVMENILLGMEPTRIAGVIDYPTMRRKAMEALEQLGRGDIDLNAPAGSLSVAQQQLVEIGRAVAVGSRVLVFDEPTSSLTAKDIELLFTLIHRLRQQGHAIVYISHFLEEVKEISDRYTVLRDGRSVGSGQTADATTNHIISLMVGRSVENLYPRSAHTPGEAVIELDNVSGAAKPEFASLTLRRGEVVGIAGLIGAGRTELLRTIFGLDKVKRGELKILEVSHGQTKFATITRGKSHSPAQSWRQKLGIVSEDRKTEGLALGLSITDNLTLSKLPLLINPAKLDSEATAWSQKLFVKARTVRQPIGDLSGGNQQKVAIARLLYHDADVFLLDEPTRGIDVGSKAQIYQVIDELAARNKAVLVVSSYLPELLGICDRIAVMSRGVLGTTKLVSETNEHKIMQEAIGAETDGTLEAHGESR
jgi:ribose transport system ATP-binding protein